MFPFQCCAVNTIRFSSSFPRPLDLPSGERASRSLTDALSPSPETFGPSLKCPKTTQLLFTQVRNGAAFPYRNVYIHPYIMYILYIYRFFRVALREGAVMVANISTPTPLVVQKWSIIMSTLLPHLRSRLLQEKHVDRLKESREYWRFCLKIPGFV